MCLLVWYSWKCCFLESLWMHKMQLPSYVEVAEVLLKGTSGQMWLQDPNFLYFPCNSLLCFYFPRILSRSYKWWGEIWIYSEPKWWIWNWLCCVNRPQFISTWRRRKGKMMGLLKKKKKENTLAIWENALLPLKSARSLFVWIWTGLELSFCQNLIYSFLYTSSF